VILSCAEMISAVHVGSLEFDCSFASRSATSKENIPIHYYQIDGVIELPLHRRYRNPIAPLPPLENQILIPNLLESLILERRLLIRRLL